VAPSGLLVKIFTIFSPRFGVLQLICRTFLCFPRKTSSAIMKITKKIFIPIPAIIALAQIQVLGYNGYALWVAHGPLMKVSNLIFGGNTQ